MGDVVSQAVRSRMMSGIRGKNTNQELVLRSGLHRLGFRFRVHQRGLAGKPDLVFPRYRAVIFAHGCFWHGHHCHLFKWPSTRPEFWKSKIEENRRRDIAAVAALKAQGWRVGEVWECALKGKARLPAENVLAQCAAWLQSDTEMLEVTGNETRTPL